MVSLTYGIFKKKIEMSRGKLIDTKSRKAAAKAKHKAEKRLRG